MTGGTRQMRLSPTLSRCSKRVIDVLLIAMLISALAEVPIKDLRLALGLSLLALILRIVIGILKIVGQHHADKQEAAPAAPPFCDPGLSVRHRCPSI